MLSRIDPKGRCSRRGLALLPPSVWREVAPHGSSLQHQHQKHLYPLMVSRLRQTAPWDQQSIGDCSPSDEATQAFVCGKSREL